jgi:signal transduction histidine kinase
MDIPLLESGITTDERSILEEIRLKISEGNLLSDILDAIFHDIQKIVPCDRLAIGLVEENGQRIEICHGVAPYQPQLVNAGYIEDIESPFLQMVFQNRTQSVSNNLQEYVRGHDTAELAQLFLKEGILSCIVTPVLLDSVVEGILFCGSKKIDSYSERHAGLVGEVAKALTRPVEKTYQLVLLEQNHQAYLEMLSFVSHELKSPISSIITLGRTMADGYYGKVDEKQRDILGRIIKKAEYLHAVSNKYLNLSHLESNDMVLHPQLVDFIEDVIEPAIELIAPQIEERGIKFERGYSPTVFPVQCDPDLAKIVVLNLLSNGIRYGNKGGSLKISMNKGYKQFSAVVWNEGPGFSERNKYLLFKRFSRLLTKELADRKGSGVGLYVSWKIIHLHGGRIFADSDNRTWAQFTFELPQYMDLCIVG